MAMSRNDVKQRCKSVLGVPIATGTIQKLIDRASAALFPVYAHIGRIARRFWCNYIDETSWFQKNDLHLLWAMVNERVAFYRIDPHRSKEAFEQLVQDWDGILVSDGYGLYRKWDKRQTCLVHLIRKADALAEKEKAWFAALRRNHRRLVEKTCIVCQRTSEPKTVVSLLYPFSASRFINREKGRYNPPGTRGAANARFRYAQPGYCRKALHQSPYRQDPYLQPIQKNQCNQPLPGRALVARSSLTV
jgi:hypothetical protein